MIRFFVKHALAFVVLLVALCAAAFVACTGSDCNDDGNCVKTQDGGSTQEGGAEDGGGTDGGGPGQDGGTPLLALDRTMFDFGTVATATTSAPATFTLTNSGDGSSDVLEVKLEGADAAQFKLEATACAGKKLDAGKKCEITVNFAPTAGAAASATLTVTSSSASAAPATLSATGAASGALTVLPVVQGFGVAVAGSHSADQSFKVTNTGNAATGNLAVTVTGSDAALFKTSADACNGKPLAAGASCDLAVHFAPTVIGARSASLVIAAAPGGTATSGLFGLAIQSGQLTLSPTSFDFPSVLEATDGGVQQFNLTNTGLMATGPLTAAVGGSQASDFKLAGDACTGKALASGETCNFSVQFMPATAGAKVGSVSVTGDPGGSAAATLSGSGLGQAAMTATPSPLNVGTVVQSQQSTAVVTIKNTGGIATGTPTLGGATSGDYTFTNNCSGPIDPGKTCTITVAITATQTGTRMGTLTVNATPGGSVSVPLSANAVAKGALSLSPTSWDFPPTPEGSQSAPKQFTVTNTGGSTSGVPMVSLTGTGAGEYTITNNGCTAAITAGSSCTIDVAFIPSTSSPAASLTVTDTGGTTIAGLTGTGQAPASLAIAPLTHNYPATVVNQSSAVHTFTVTNNGDLSTSTMTVGLGGTDQSQFTIGTNTCTGQLAGKTSCTVDVTFTPTTTGSKSASISVSAAPNGGTVSASLGGTGETDAKLDPQTGSPLGTNDFGDQEIGVVSVSQFTFTVKNTGDVTTGTITSTNSNASVLIVAGNTCDTTSLAKNATCQVIVNVKPAAAGPLTETLTLNASPGGPLALTVKAFGKRKITVTRNGGNTSTTIQSSPAVFNPTTCTAASCTALVTDGTSLTIQARNTDGSGYHFSSWTTTGGCSGTFRDCTVTMNQSRSVTANYTASSYNLAFLTNATFAANAHSGAGGAAGYDSDCNTAATAAGINNSTHNAFVAWMSDASSAASTRLTTAGGFMRLDDRPFALSKSALQAKAIIYPLDVDEHGQNLGDQFTWTGSSDTGTVRSSGTCTNWTSTSGNADAAGRSGGGPGLWTIGQVRPCSEAHRIYCLGNKISTTISAPTVPAGGKIAYFTLAAYNATGGLSNANSTCNGDKPTGFTTRTYVALLSTTGAAASTLLNQTASYYRPDGAFIGTGADIAAASSLTSGIWVRSDLTYQGGEVQAWTGSFVPGLAGDASQTCTSWTTGGSTGSGTGLRGEVNSTNSSFWDSLSSSCTFGSIPLYCIEQ